MSTAPVTPVTTPANKYAAAILNVVGVFATALIAVVAGPFTWTVAAQLGLVLIGAVVAFIVPLSASKWSGYLKTGAVIVAAILTALLPFLTEGVPTLQNWLVVGLAAVTALGTELGVQIRTKPLDAGTYVPGASITNLNVSNPVAVASSIGGTVPDYVGRHEVGNTVPPIADASVDNSGDHS